MRKQIITTHLGTPIAAVILATLFILPISASQILPAFTPVSNPPHTIAPVIYVNANNTQGPWDGTFQHPYQHIQDGIDHVASHGTVFVFHGIYSENIVIYKDDIDVIGERSNDTIIDGQGVGTCVRFTSDSSSIRSFTIQNSGMQGNDSAVTLDGTHCDVIQNIIQRSFFGVYAINHPNKIFYNNFLDNTVHAYSEVPNIWSSGVGGGNYWEGLAKIDTNEDGIIDTPYNVPGGAGQDGYPLLHPYGSVVDRNSSIVFFTIAAAIADISTMDGDFISIAMDTYWEHLLITKPLTIQGENRIQTIIDGHQLQTVISISAPNVTLQGFTVQASGTMESDCGVSVENRSASLTDLLVENNYHGILFRENASDGFVSGCTVRTNAWNGVYLSPGCSENLIQTNIIQDNGYCGLMIYQASYNTVYHNDFLNNPMQAYDSGFNVWDNGYPSGGNHWSDYTGTDANHDGIGDTPYAIPGGTGVDRYPLMQTYDENDTTPPFLEIVSPTNGLYIRNHQILGRLIPNRITIVGAIEITADAYDSQSGISEVRFYLDNNVDPSYVATVPPYTWNWIGASPLKHKHNITVFAFDNAGNTNQASIDVHRWL